MPLYLAFNGKWTARQNVEFTEIKIYLTVTCSEAEVKCGQKVKQVFVSSAFLEPKAHNLYNPYQTAWLQQLPE